MRLCGCGCGKPTKLAPWSDQRRGWIRGQPLTFIHGHHNRLQHPGYREENRGYSAGPCWIYAGFVDRKQRRGYAHSTWRGKTTGVYRIYYETRYGPIPSGMTLDHLCRQRDCINPEHLEVATMRANVLRGTGPTATNARKTHCLYGHPLSGANLRMVAKGARPRKARRCQTCQRAAEARYRARQRQDRSA